MVAATVKSVVHKQPLPRPAAAPAGYLVSPQNQHVTPAACGEVRPLRLGRNLQLQVRELLCGQEWWVCDSASQQPYCKVLR